MSKKKTDRPFPWLMILVALILVVGAALTAHEFLAAARSAPGDAEVRSGRP